MASYSSEGCNVRKKYEKNQQPQSVELKINCITVRAKDDPFSSLSRTQECHKRSLRSVVH